MNERRFLRSEWGERVVLGLLFVAIGSLIMVVFSPWNPLLAAKTDYLGRFFLAVLLGIMTYLTHKSQRFERYWLIVFGLFTLLIAVSLDWVFGIYLIKHLGISAIKPSGWALPKLNEAIVVVSVVVFCTRLSNHELGSIYIQKGSLKTGLLIGSVTFFIAAAASIPMANLFYGRDLTLVRILPWTPWILIFVLANAAMEEIMFRGLFLRKLEPFFGRFLSNFMIAFVFTLMHGAVTYTSDTYIFLAVLFPLALAWGAIMQKTDSVWGSILFHAGMDIPIILGVFSNLS